MSRWVGLLTLMVLLACGGLAPQFGSMGPPWNTMHLPTSEAEVIFSTSMTLTLNYPHKTNAEVLSLWEEEAQNLGWKKIFADVKPDTTSVLYSDGDDNYMLVLMEKPDGVMANVALVEGEIAAGAPLSDLPGGAAAGGEALAGAKPTKSPTKRTKGEPPDVNSKPAEKATLKPKSASKPIPKPKPKRSSWGSSWVANLSSGDCKGIAEKNSAWCDSDDCKGIADGNSSWCSTGDCKGVVEKNSSWCDSDLCEAWADGNSSWCDNGDCKGIVEKNSSWCDSAACKAIADGNSSWCP
jgi:hypothetical protein